MSFPVPVSPVMSTVASVGARRSIRAEDLAHRHRAPDHRAKAFMLARHQFDSFGERPDPELNRANSHDRPGLQIRFFDLGAIQEGSVGRTEIPEEKATCLAHDLTVDSGNGSVVEDELALRTLTNPKNVALDHMLSAASVASDLHQRAPRKL